MSPTPRAVWIIAGLALGALILPLPLVIAAMAAVLAAAVADAWTVRAVPEVERSAPPVLSRGVPGRIEVRPRVDGTRIRLRQPSGDSDLWISPQEGVGRLAAEVVALRRGRHLLPPVATLATGPLGLGRWYHRSGTDSEVVVFPDLPAARRLAMEVRTGRFREEGRRSRGPIGLGTELEGIREYLPDDDIRQVNWTATARVGIPMSNTHRVEQDRDVVCLVDCGRLMASPVGAETGIPRTRLDVAVDVVAAMAAVTAEVGDHIGAIAFSDRILRSVPPRRDNTDIVLHAVHDLEPETVDADYEAAFRLAAGMRRAFVLVLTDLLDERAGEPLARAIPVLSRRHSVTVASLRDEDVHRALTTPAPDLTEAIETAVAAALLQARDRLAARIRRSGVEIVEAPLQSLPERCVAAYLRAKRRSRL